MRRWIICAVALALANCGSTERTRYKMTVEVETADGVSSGYAVREIRYSEPPSVPSIGESRPQWRATGEAVAIDLPNGRTLFALLTSGDGDADYAARGVWFLFRELVGDAPGGVIELWPAMPETKAPRIGNPLPLLVTFQNLKDPKTLGQVDPKNIGATFGSGFSLKRITMERTSESVTSGIEKALPWLDSVGRSRSTLIPNPPRLLKDATPIGLVAPSDFTTELYK